MYLPEPYALTPEDITDFKLNLLKLKEDELLIDLGCGNAHTLIKAYKLAEIKGIGYELRPEAINDARKNIALNNLEEHITIKEIDFLKANVSQADALFLYLTRNSLGKLSLKLEQELKPGTRVVTHDFDIPAWKEKEKHLFTNHIGAQIEVYLYIV